MHHNRVAALILGAWMAGSLLMVFLAARNFHLADDVLKSPPPSIAAMIRTLGANQARLFLRHLVGNENRFYFSGWEQAQLALGAALTIVLLLLARNRLLAGFSAAMLILVVFGHYKITPELDWLSGVIEFQPVTADSTQRDQFWKLHTMYGVMEITKLLLGVVIAGFLFTFSRRRRNTKMEPDFGDTASQLRSTLPVRAKLPQ